MPPSTVSDPFDGQAPLAAQTEPDAACAPSNGQVETDLDVAIIGGGPGGLAAANAILTASPRLRVGVFERSTLRPRGASVLVHPNGINALAAINPKLAKGVKAIDSHPGTAMLFARDGTLTGTQAQGESPVQYIREHGGSLSLCTWHELQSVLAAALPKGVLHQAAAFAGLEQSADGTVLLHFASGVPPVRARVVIGADGGQSAVRQATLGDGPPLFMDTALWRAVFPRPSWWPQEPGAYCIHGVPPQVSGTVPLHDGSLAWLGVAPWPKERLDEIGGAGAHYTADPVERREQGEARRARALEAFGGWCDQVLDIIRGVDALVLTEHPQFYRTAEACQVWGHGNVTLLGDAAHLATPALGQGTSMAFEDALELGRSIGKHGPTAEALRAYEALRQPQVEVIHRRSLEMFAGFAAGGALLKNHVENEKMGTWARKFVPLSAAAEE